ncbi:syntaxin-binding protein 5-like [Ditylenchus destructor]|nr:syntaxin-binding protein 5-like [Ditylenchus destructor]
MHQSHHSSMTPPPNSAPVKSFMRLNTECGKQRSVERHSRPLLSKAQSMAVSYVTGTSGFNNGNNLAEPSQSNNSPLGDNCNGDLTNATENNTSHVSRSSSANSLEKLASQDCVTSLTFINCSSKKGSSKSEPCLWLGTSKGACVAFNLILPNDRIISNVVVAPSDMYDGPQGSVIRLQERILYSTFLNRSLCIIMGAAEIYKDSSKESAPTSANIDKALQNKIITKPSLAPTQLTNQQENGGSTTCPPADDFSHAKSSHVRGYPVLMCLNAAGHVQVLTLPSLKMLYQTPLFRCSVDWDDPICQKTDFSEHGLGMYMASPTEVQKFTINSELAAQVAECAGELFVPCDMPEPPKASFFRGVSTLFASSGQRDNVDLDSIFSEKPSTTAVSSMKSIARQIPSSSLTTNSLPLNNMEATNSRNISAGQAATMAIQNLNERGERLNAVVDATENLRNNAMNMYSRSSKLVEKYEKKKWYQL